MKLMQKEVDRIRSSNLARNAGWIFAGQGFSVFCQGTYFVLLARLLGATEYGIYVGAYAMVSILSVYSPLGSPPTLVSHVSLNPGAFACHWGNVLFTTLTLGCVFVGVLVWIVPHTAHSYTWELVFCAAAGDCLCGPLTIGAAAAFQAFENMRFNALVGMLTNFSRSVLGAFLLWKLHHATAQQWAAANLAVSFGVACTAVTLVTWQHGKPGFSLRLLRERVGEGFVFALCNSTTGLYNNFDKAMLGHYGMNAANGIYAMAYRVVDVCTVPMGSIHAAAFPRFFREGAGGTRKAAAFGYRILMRTAPLTLLLAIAMAVSAPAIPHLVGNSFSQSVSVLRWLCLLPFFRCFQYSAGDALVGAGLQKLRLGTQSVAAAFDFGVNLYLIPHYGWRGAAWSSLATDGLLGISNWAVLLLMRSNMDRQLPLI